MASRTLVVLEDDLDGGEAAETIEFALDGVQYQIDLNEQNAEQLRGALDKFVDKARRVGGRRSTRKPSTNALATPVFAEVDNATVRAWAQSNGITVSSRGRIPADVIRQVPRSRELRFSVSVTLPVAFGNSSPNLALGRRVMHRFIAPGHRHGRHRRWSPGRPTKPCRLSRRDRQSCVQLTRSPRPPHPSSPKP